MPTRTDTCPLTQTHGHSHGHMATRTDPCPLTRTHAHSHGHMPTRTDTCPLTQTHDHSHSSHSSHPHPPACPHTDMSHPPAWMPTPSCLSHPLPAFLPPHACPPLNPLPPSP